MAESNVFAFVCERLEHDTSLDRLEARGTVRIALKQAGLEPREVDASQMRVVLERILPGELASRGVADGDAICRRLVGDVNRIRSGASADAPDAVFARLGGAG